MGIALLASATLFAVACNKEESTAIGADTTDQVIAVAAADSSGTGKDSTYFFHPCGQDYSLDSVAADALPAAIGVYLQDNYEGYTLEKAYAVNDASGTTSEYVVVIYDADVPVGLVFDAEGNFLRVLEHRRSRK